jgi:hypothetical protein
MMVTDSPLLSGDRGEAVRPPLWSAFLVLALPFLPVVTAIAAYEAGLSRGCQPGSADVCLIAGLDVADIIQFAMAAAWLIIFGVVVPMLVATSVVHRSLEGFSTRFAFGGMLPAAVAIGSVLAPTIVAAIIKPPDCSLRELGPACHVFGADMQQAFALAGAAPWPLVFAVVPAVIYAAIYAIVLGFDELGNRNRARIAARASEAAARESGLPPLSADAPPQRKSNRPPRKPLVYIPPKRPPRLPPL